MHEDRQVRLSWRRVLVEAGYAVHAVADERRTVSGFGRRPYDLVIADMSRRSVLHQALADADPAPLVLIARKPSFATVLDALEAGAWDLVDASARPEETLDVVRRAVAYGRLQTHLRSMARSRAVTDGSEYQRVIDQVNALAADVRREKRDLRTRARRDHRLPA